MSQAQTFLAQLRDGGESAIDALILRRTSEEVYLDFKRSADDGKGATLHPDDRENMRKAISGFGNSGGGLIVWGVDCPSRSDAATAKLPLKNAAGFKSLLDGAVGGATVPPHGGVENHIIGAKPDGTGYVATLVPFADNSPLQVSGRSAYYMRAGSSFQHIPHAVLGAMFGRRPAPQLVIRCQSCAIQPWSNDAPTGVHVLTEVHVVNEGLGIARDLYVTLNVVSLPNVGAAYDVKTYEDSRMEILRRSDFFSSLVSRERGRFPPGESVRAFWLSINLGFPVTDRLQIELVAGCENGPPTYLTFAQSKARLEHTLGLALRSNADPVYLAKRALGLAKEPETPFM